MQNQLLVLHGDITYYQSSLIYMIVVICDSLN